MRHAWVVLTAIVVALTASCSGAITTPSLSPSAGDRECAPGERSVGSMTDITGEDTVRREYPETTAAAWVGGALWTANEAALLSRWDVRDSRYIQYSVPDGSVIRSLTGANDQLVAGVDGGVIWILTTEGWQSERACEAGAVVSMVVDEEGRLWCACPDEGLVRVSIVFDRLFFVPHLHGLNHPPDYTEDRHGVLGFREFAAVFQEEIGFVPVMIAGEGGWRLGEQQDSRYPAVSEDLHRDYHIAVFDWFRRRRLSDGEPLPDYLLAFCVWLVSDPDDPAAWFDSKSGDRRLTIEAVARMTHQG